MFTRTLCKLYMGLDGGIDWFIPTIIQLYPMKLIPIYRQKCGRFYLNIVFEATSN